MAREWDPKNVFDVFGHEEIRRILALADEEAMSAEELAERLSVSQPTVYRRINVCQEYGLLSEETRIDEEGNHYKVYETTLERISFEVDSGGFDVSIELRRDVLE